MTAERIASLPTLTAAAPWLHEGQRWEARGRLDDALVCYDHALDLAGADAMARGLVWMNRGSALQRFGDREHTFAALAAYVEASTLLRRPPHAGDPAWRISFAAALMNRGLLLHRLHGVAHAATVFATYAEADGVLRPLLAREPTATVRRNLGGIGVNRANLFLDLDAAAPAFAAARDALAVVAPVERTELDAAGVALMARRALCDALGRLLVEPGADQDALAAQASDLVDDALALARHWGEAGRDPFAPLVARLYRYGARLYRVHQPQFLGEFLFEQLASAPPPELLAIAAEALAGALDDLQRPQPLVAGAPATERVLAIVRDLRAARIRLAAIGPALPPRVARQP